MEAQPQITDQTEPRRHASGVVRPDCVAKAGPVAVAVWYETVERLEAGGVCVTSLDSRALAAYCVAWQRFDDAEEMIDQDGLTCTSKSGALYQHPAVGIANKAQEQILKLSARLLLTPLDRKRGGLKIASSQAEGVQRRG